MNFKKYHVSRNLFDKSTAVIGERVLQKSVLEDAGAAHSDYIDVTGISTLTVNKKYAATNFYFYTDKTNTSIGYANDFTANVPAGAKYCRINVLKDDVDTIMLNAGSTALPYEPYSPEVWHDLPHYIHKTATDTITTLPAVLYPNDTTATVRLKGNMEQSSQPSPTSPIQPQECGERTENLAWTGWAADAVTRIGNTNLCSLQNVDGRSVLWFNVSAGYQEYDTKYLFKTDFKANTQYTFSFEAHRPSNQASSSTMQIRYTDDTYTSIYMYSGNSFQKYTVTSDAGKTIKYIRAQYTSGTAEIDLNTFMVNEGTTPLPYEPYGIKIPILLNSQTINKYLGEVQTERQIIKYEFTGKENWIRESGNTYALEGVEQTATGYANTLCTHYILATSYNALIGTDGTFTVSKRPALFIHDENYTSATQLKNYLATQYNNGTPVTIYYTLNTPTTGIINEPLMKIGNYADSLTTSIPCTAGENTLDVQTTVQPSEVTVNYKGWHPVADVHEYDSNYTIATMQALTIAQLQTHTISELQGGEWS